MLQHLKANVTGNKLWARHNSKDDKTDIPLFVSYPVLVQEPKRVFDIWNTQAK